MRAAKYKHYGCENKSGSKVSKNTENKPHKKVKALSFVIAFSLAAALLVIPTTTLAPDVDAFEDSKASSYSIGDIDDFSAVIKDNCVAPSTAPATIQVTEAAKETKAATKPAEKATEKAKEETKPTETQTTVSKSVEESETDAVQNDTYYESSENTEDYSGSYLVSISNPDSKYNPTPVSLSSYDRAKLERLVMGEAGSMGYTGCALVAQAVRDAMNRSNTTSIDAIISEYKYYAPTNKEPNQTVKDAVSYIFDENGSAVQHRILCFYTGTSKWHETQNFIVGCGNVRFFDLW